MNKEYYKKLIDIIVDIYLIHLNLNVDIYRYGTNVLLYKYYLYIIIEL